MQVLSLTSKVFMMARAPAHSCCDGAGGVRDGWAATWRPHYGPCPWFVNVTDCAVRWREREARPLVHRVEPSVARRDTACALPAAEQGSPPVLLLCAPCEHPSHPSTPTPTPSLS